MRKIARCGIVMFSAMVIGLTAWPAGASASASYLVPGAAAACGARCFDLSSLVLGPDAIQNAYVRGDDGAGARIGQPVNLRRSAGLHPNEDFTGAKIGQLTDYCGAFISVRSYPCVHFPGSYPVFESDWSPFGDRTDLCAGIAGTASDGTSVTLRHCGASAGTLWVGDLADAVSAYGRPYAPWVNCSDPGTGRPLVLTVNTGSYLPENRLKLRRLDRLGAGVAGSQEFTVRPDPAA